jgi:hypothetical protein
VVSDANRGVVDQTVNVTGEVPETLNDASEFAAEIIPRLQVLPIRALAQATGLSSTYIRRVKHVPPSL